MSMNFVPVSYSINKYGYDQFEIIATYENGSEGVIDSFDTHEEAYKSYVELNYQLENSKYPNNRVCYWS
jgi:hypothetical protein